MVWLTLFACSQSPNQGVEAGPVVVPPSIPEAAPAPAKAGLEAKTPIDEVLAKTPKTVSDIYAISLGADRKELTIDPALEPTARGARDRTGGFEAKDSAKGGKVITLAGGAFARGGWMRGTLAYFVSDAEKQKTLKAAGFRLDNERDLLIVLGENDTKPTIFAFSEDASKRGMVGICNDVTVLDFAVASTPSKPMVVRKPVIYLYPEQPTEVVVDVELEGEFIAQYPPMGPKGWVMKAEPDGTLHAPDGRTHRYLFWEGIGADFSVDPKAAFCVAQDDAVDFLEETCGRFAMNDAECGDFASYWLPTFAAHPYTLVGFPEAEYEAFARLSVTPRPDTVIRAFMVLEGVDARVKVQEPVLQPPTRKGFTVVEWGGVDVSSRRD